MNEIYKERHKKVALPCTRVRTPKGSGSGTIIYGSNNGEGYSTYILTNHHVVSHSIKIEKKWSSLAKAYRKIDILEMVDVDFYSYKWESRAIGAQAVQCDIVAYDEDEDLALLKSRSYVKPPAVVELYPRDKENELLIGMKVIAVGAGLGEDPVQTEGILSQFGQEIDNREYWLNTAPTIFGNSGGALFLKETFHMIGVPARISVSLLGFSADPITHLSYSIPITRIYNFLDDQRYRFIYDDQFTEDGEAELRNKIREAEERKLAIGDLIE